MGNRKTSLREETEAGTGQSPFVGSVLLLVRLWSGDSAQGLPPPALAVAMVEDLLSASGCELKKGVAPPIEGVSPNLVQAVNAARRIARLVRSFSGSSEEGALDGYLTVSRATDSISALDLALLQQTRILEPTRPGQVFFVGAVCEAVRKVPGLSFTDLSGIVKAQGTGTRNLALQLLPPTGMDGADGSPLVFKPSRPKPRIEPLAIVPEPVPQIFLNQTEDIAGRVPLQAEKLATALPSSSLAMSQGTKALLQRAKLTRKTGIIAMASVTVLIVAGVYLGHSSSVKVSPTPESVNPTALQSTQDSPEQHSATATLPGSNKAGEAAAPNEPKDNHGSQTFSTKAKKADLAHGGAKSRGEIASTDVPTKLLADKGIVSFNPREIDKLIEKADKEVGDGKFDMAIGNYSIALKHDPANVRARQGIARARKNKGSG